MCIVQTMKQDVTRENRGLHSMARKLFQKGNSSFIRVLEGHAKTKKSVILGRKNNLEQRTIQTTTKGY